MPATFRLDKEQRQHVRDCLSKDGVSLRLNQFSNFVSNIESSIDVFVVRAKKESFRDAHDALRKLWTMCAQDDPQIALIRKSIGNLPDKAVEYLDQRGLNVIPRLFPTEPLKVQEWARKTDAKNLVNGIRLMTAEGAQIVAGRSRGGGKRSESRIGPIIMGETRGIGAGKRRGGRPANSAQADLVMHLAADWLESTGKVPILVRSDKDGFGDLVHCVFQWLDLPEGSAAYALRTYGGAVKEYKLKSHENR